MLTYTAFDRLATYWQPPSNAPKPQSFEPFYLTQWLGWLRIAKQDMQQEVRENLLNLDDKSKLHYIEELHAQLEAAVDRVAKLPTVTRANLRQALQRGKQLSHSAAYTQVVDSLDAQRHEEASPQRDETAALLYQNEAAQAVFVDVYLLITHRLAALRQEPARANKSQPSHKEQPALTWNAGPKDLLDLLLTLQEKQHLTINEKDPRKLSQAIMSLFELSHESTAPASADWQIFRPYLASIDRKRNPDKSVTETHEKRAKKSLYNGIEPFKS